MLFHALSDTTRRSILRTIAGGRRTVGEIAREYPMSLNAVSKHLKVLEGADLISRERRGTSQWVGLKAESLLPAEAWLAFYEQFWTSRLDALQNHLEEETEDGKRDGAK